MRIYSERYDATEIRCKAWAGAISTLDLLTDEEIENINRTLEEIYPEGIDETAYNDFWWFDTEFIAEHLGYPDFETMFLERSKEGAK